MEVFTNEILAALKANGKAQSAARAEGKHTDFTPVVKLYVPMGQVWLLTEIPAGDETVVFGLKYSNAGVPELGHVDLAEFATLRGRHGFVKRDENFLADKKLSVYADESTRFGCILA
ncbi:MAG: DUF2958 domain-containing protein [Bacteroidota bacterium]